MKTPVIAACLFACILAGCNEPSKPSGDVSQTTDIPRITLKDISASTDIRTLLCQDWENKEDAQDAALSGGSEGLETTYRGLSFFVDSSVVENPRDKIRFGKWSFDEGNKVIQIAFEKSATARYKIVAIGARQMILLNVGDKKKTEFQADAKVHPVPAEDPFHRVNNLWRIKPGRAESDSGIKVRTGQSLIFYSKFLADNADRAAASISFTGLPGCLKWYRGGVSVISKEKLDKKWIGCFYNNEQAIKGQDLVERIITKKYKWNKNEKKWVRQSADVVLQMYDTLRVL